MNATAEGGAMAVDPCSFRRITWVWLAANLAAFDEKISMLVTKKIDILAFFWLDYVRVGSEKSSQNFPEVARMFSTYTHLV